MTPRSTNQVSARRQRVTVVGARSSVSPSLLCQPRVVVDGRMDVGVTHPLPKPSSLSATHPPPIAAGDASELLDVHVHQVTRALMFIATGHLAGGAVQPAQVVQAEPAPHPLHRRRGHPETEGDAQRPDFLPLAQVLGSPLQAPRCTSGTAVGREEWSWGPSSPSTTQRRHQRPAVVRETLISAATWVTARPLVMHWTRMSRPSGVSLALACKRTSWGGWRGNHTFPRRSPSITRR